MQFMTLEEVLAHEIEDLFSAEEQLVEALPKMAKGAYGEDLKAGFEEHLQQTKEHVRRLREAGKLLGIDLPGKECKGMMGLIKEGDELLKQGDPTMIRDAALISAAQRVEHYEIAGYGSAITMAEKLELDDVADLLKPTLDDEKETDEKLTEIAEDMVYDELEEV